jgi:hypothetical protein
MKGETFTLGSLCSAMGDKIRARNRRIGAQAISPEVSRRVR